MSKPYVVSVVIEAKSGKEDALKQALLDVVEPSRAEAACLAYHLHQDLNYPTRFFLYERWKSEALHQEQFQKPYILDLVERLDGLLAKPFEPIFSEEI